MKTSFLWGDQYLTGFDEIDSQHRKLVHLINTLGEQLTPDEPNENELSSIFGQLVEYTLYHFTEEEEMMHQCAIDHRHLELHLSAHQDFVSEVQVLQEQLSENSRQSRQRLLSFLINWLGFHILGTDQNMARQIASIHAGVSPEQAYLLEETHSHTAVRPLLNAVTSMYEIVSERNKELLELNQTLENRISERTLALQKANERLNVLASTDSLTGLANRREGMAQLELLWQEAINKHQSLVCMMVDADGFKSVNDQYGHSAGDRVLMMLAEELKSSVRTDDIVCRLGGDEFLLICPNTEIEGGRYLAQTLLERINRLRIDDNENNIWCGEVSIGVSGCKPVGGEFVDLVKRADRAVYQAKKAGRNCVRTL